MAYKAISFDSKVEIKPSITYSGGYKPVVFTTTKPTEVEVVVPPKKESSGEKFLNFIKKGVSYAAEKIEAFNKRIDEQEQKRKESISKSPGLYSKPKAMEFKIGDVGIEVPKEAQILPGPRVEAVQAKELGIPAKILKVGETPAPGTSLAEVAQKKYQAETAKAKAESVWKGLETKQLAQEEFMKKEYGLAGNIVKDIQERPQELFALPEISRKLVQFGLDLVGSDTPYSPQHPIAKYILGDEPIQAESKRTQDFITSYGLGGAIIIGSLEGLAAIPELGSVGAKAISAKVAEGIARRGVENVTEDVLKTIVRDAIRAEKVSDPAIIEKATNDFIKDYQLKIQKAAEFKTQEVPPAITQKIEPTAPRIVDEVVKDLDIAKQERVSDISIPQTTTSPTEKLANEVTDIKASGRKALKEEVPSFEIPEETRWQKFKRNIQDKMGRLEDVQKKITSQGKQISREADAYLQQELYIGRASDKIDKLESDIVKSARKGQRSLLERMTDDGITVDELGDYLHAKHAPERNAQISKINDIYSDGGSGLTNKEASDILNNLNQSGKGDKLETYAQEFYDKITRERLKVLEESGLITPELAQTLRETYKNYVPLKRVMDTESFGTRGQGFSLSGKDVKRAKGSKRAVQNPVIQGLYDLEDTIVRAEKNKVAQAFKNLVEENPNPKLWEVEKLQYTPVYDKFGELQYMDPKYKFADNVLEVREGGKTSLITIHDKALAEGLKGLGVERGFKVLNSVNNYLRAINTTMNPEFLITNFARDLQTAGINIAGEQGAKMAKDVVKDIPAAMKGIWQNLQGDTTGEWSKIYADLKESGGKMGWFDRKSVDQKMKEVVRTLEDYNKTKKLSTLRKGFSAVGEYIENVNEVVESAVRASAFHHAIKNGSTIDEAARLAKNLTVNFNKKGNWGVAINSLYLFANAGIQGSARILTALKYPRVRKIVGGVVAASLGINEMNRVINEKEYKKIPDSVKDRNLIFMMPNGNYLKIALPYGYNIFKILGDIGSEAIHGENNISESMKRIVIALNDSFNPLSSADLLQTVSPTFLDPFVQISTNKNWFGSKIKPDQPQFGPKKRESSLYFSSVRPGSKAITEWLNDITGGSEIEKGFIDISPEIVDYVLDFLGGGAGQTVVNTVTGGVGLFKGELPDVSNIPFVRKVVGTPSEFYESSVIRDTLKKSSTGTVSPEEEQEFKDAIKIQLQKKEIDMETAKRSVTEYMNNVDRVNAGRVFDKFMAGTPEEKKEILLGLSEGEREQLKKLFTKAMESQK